MVFNQPFNYRALPPGVKALLGVNVGMFALQWVFSLMGGPNLSAWLGLTPASVTGHFALWQPVTYMFLHGGFFHLFFNAFMLWTLGREIEFRWGNRAFLYYYFLCGVGAAGFNILFEPRSPFPVVGASGAIYGLLVAFAMMYPTAVFYLWFLIPLRAKHAVMLFAGLELLFSFSANRSGIANLAHLGGMLTGFLYLKSGTWRLDWRRWLGRRAERPVRRASARRETSFHELGQEVDRILEKISREGLSRLTPEEQALMERYSRLKR